MAMVNMENYEEYLMLYADGELSEAERHEVELVIAANPALKNELDMLATIKIIPETEFVFEYKEQLLKKEAKTISPKWWVYGAAAGIAALIAITLMKQPAPETIVINKKQPTKQVTQPVVKQHPVRDIATEKASKPQVAMGAPIQKSKVVSPVKKEKKTAPQEPIQYIAEVKPLETANSQQETLKAEEPEMQPISEVALPAVAKHTVPAPPAQSDELPSWLPVEKDRLSGLMELTAAVDINLEKAREIKENIKNSDVTFKIGKKELFVVRL